MKSWSAWILFVIAALSAGMGRAQQLVLYSMPSPYPLNWRTPHTLFMSYARNLVMPNRYPRHRHPMGHMLVELRDSSRYSLVGAVARSRTELFNSVAKYKYGLGTLFTVHPGLLETKEDNYHQLLDRYPKGDIAYIKLLISQETFERLWRYLDEYRKNGYDTLYNGQNRPRGGKGAGCSAFAVSFIEVGELLDSNLLRQWQVRVNVQEKLIGGPEGDDRRINTFIMAFTQRWADTAKHKYKPLVYYEPGLVYNWINDKCRQRDSSLAYEVKMRDNAPGIIIDLRNLPTPTEDIWIDVE